MTDARIAEAYIEVLGTVAAVAWVAEAYVEVLLQPYTPPDARTRRVTIVASRAAQRASRW